MGGLQGIRFSKVISYGNAADLNETDLLEYLSQDAETEIIAAYIEGVRDGQRFLRTLVKAAKAKPVIMLKGGRSEAGIKTTASHTGALAGNNEKWDALCQQVEVIQVYNLQEMLDLITAFLYVKPPKGQRVGIVGTGGGASVISTDECESVGLSVPTFSSELRQELKRLSSGEVGKIISNPIDSQTIAHNHSALSEAIKAIANCKQVDLLLMHTSCSSGNFRLDPKRTREWLDTVIETGKSIDIPMAIVLLGGDTPESSGQFFELQQRSMETGTALYPTFSRAAQAISRLVQYHTSMNGERG